MLVSGRLSSPVVWRDVGLDMEDVGKVGKVNEQFKDVLRSMCAEVICFVR